MTHSSPVRLIVTQGEPTGVGPELILKLAAAGEFGSGDIVVADPEHLRRVAAALDCTWAKPGLDAVLPLCDGESGLTAVQALERGVDLVLGPEHRALVTAPIDKAICMAQGFAYPGHTEYLAHRAGECEVAMLMAGPVLRVVLATVHVPLASVPTELSSERIVRSSLLLAQALRERFGVQRPRIAVLGLNPHAGEKGMLGTEEQTTIAPAISVAASRDPNASFVGPLPADTAMFAHAQGEFDGVVAMFHDQGLGPFKLVHFHDGVNVTLGLPFVRTSPDHGTATDIVGTGTANPSSFRAAVRLARGQGW